MGGSGFSDAGAGGGGCVIHEAWIPTTPQATPPRLRPRSHDTHSSGGACDGELSRLWDAPVWGLDPAHPGGHRPAGGAGTGHRARLHWPGLAPGAGGAARLRREWSINYRRYHVKRTQRDLIVLTASIGIGVGLGMLLSPRSGREARDLLQTTANQAVDRPPELQLYRLR